MNFNKTIILTIICFIYQWIFVHDSIDLFITILILFVLSMNW